ncbi:hypothetical protein C8F01DRAFT_990095 [Mycena amicta]|nr:hypothetical protein C8F01DRAFT_990095 [Mycena amicta]
MSSRIVLPGLQAWAEQHLTAIIKATSQDAFAIAFEGFMAKNASITVNGKSVSRDEYKKQLQGEGFDEAGAEVSFSGAVEVSTGLQSGVVGLFYTATIVQNVVVLDAPAESQVTSSLNLVIEEDKSLVPPHFPPGFHGFFGERGGTHYS